MVTKLVVLKKWLMLHTIIGMNLRDLVILGYLGLVRAKPSPHHSQPAPQAFQVKDRAPFGLLIRLMMLFQLRRKRKRGLTM